MLDVTYCEYGRVSQPGQDNIKNGQLEVFTLQSNIEKFTLDADPHSSRSLQRPCIEFGVV